MHSAQFQLHAEIEQRHWWFVARRRILRAMVERLVPPIARDHDHRRRLRHGGESGGIGGRLSLRRHRHFGRGDPDWLGGDFRDTKFMAGFAPDDLGQEMAHARLVLMTDVLEHVPDDFALLSALIAAMQPGAVLLLTVPADPQAVEPARREFWPLPPLRSFSLDSRLGGPAG